MTAGNPFDPTQYLLSLSASGEYNPGATGAEGVKELLGYIVDQVKLRQQAVILGFLQGESDPTGLLLPLPTEPAETTGGMYAAMTACRDATLQMLPGHPSGLWETFATVPCESDATSPPPEAVGFFRRPSSDVEAGTPTDDWMPSLDTLVADGVITIFIQETFLNPPRFEDGYITLRAYASAIGSWATAAFRILNLMRFSHPLMQTPLPFTNCVAGPGDCSFSISFNSSELGGEVPLRPIDIIVDVSGALVCQDLTGRKFGKICIEWSATGRYSRLIVTPHLSRGGAP